MEGLNQIEEVRRGSPPMDRVDIRIAGDLLSSEVAKAPSTNASSSFANSTSATLRWGAACLPQPFQSGCTTEGSSTVAPQRQIPLRRSWSLVQVLRRTSLGDRTPVKLEKEQSPQEDRLDGHAGAAAAAPSSSLSPPFCCIGHRWERNDDLEEARLLSTAARREADTAAVAAPLRRNAFLTCYDAATSAAALPVLMQLKSPLQTTDGHHKTALSSSNPFSSFFTFTREEYETLQGRQANPAARSSSCATSTSPSWPFVYDTSCLLFELLARFGNPIVVADRWPPSTAPPSPDDIAEEYHRVATGIMLLRLHRLQEAMQPLDLSSPPALTETTKTTTPRPSEAMHRRRGRSPVRPAGSQPNALATLMEKHPFFTPATAEAVGREVADGLSGPMTAKQRLAALTTPLVSLGGGGAERRRRQELRRLLERESLSNVPLQKAATRLLQLSTSAAQTFCKAAAIFFDSTPDDATTAAAVPPLDSSGSAEEWMSIAPPSRQSLVVQLPPLPGCDATTWRQTQAALRTAAEVVMTGGTTSSAATSREPKRRRVGSKKSLKPQKKVVKTKEAEAVAPQRGHRQHGDANDEKASRGSSLSRSGADDEEEEEGDDNNDDPGEDEGGSASPSQRIKAAGQRLPPSNDITYAALLDKINNSIPFTCERLLAAARAGWLLPSPPPLPHTLTEAVEEPPPLVKTSVVADEAEWRGTSIDASGQSIAREAVANADTDPILTEEAYQQLKAISQSAVVNRVVSHTSEAVLMSLPTSVSRIHREAEEELERYLYDDGTAMMELSPIAQQLIAAIRVAYTQNTLLLRFASRAEHISEALQKLIQEIAEVRRELR